MDTPFDVISTDAIRSGRATDAYFLRTERALDAAGRNPTVVAEVTARQFPTGTFDLLNGVADAIHLLAGLPIDVDAIPDGRLVDGGPVMRITGPYRAFARHETSLLGFLSQATGFATSALAVRRAAPTTPMFSFGARHVHPSLAAVVERAALTAGFDGVSHVAGADRLGREAVGTMPHSLVICFGREGRAAAWQAFDDAVDADVPRIAICDTFSDEVEEVREAVIVLGDALDAVRIDTTASRRGNFAHILREIRWTLDSMGRDDVEIVASGGIDETTIDAIDAVVDAYGIGSAITNADPVDFALDIVAVDGEAIAKRGKLPGVKNVYRTPNGDHLIALADADSPDGAEALLLPVLRDGKIVDDIDLGLDAAIDRRIRDVSMVYGNEETGSLT